MPTSRPSRPTCRSSRRCRRSIVWRCAGATPPGCTCSCGTTTSSPTVVAALVDERGVDPLFQSRTVVAAGPVLSFVYKAAAEIGELGDNTAALRAAIVDDTLLRRALMSPDSRLAVLGHTRWASVGIISEPNTHPLNSVEVEQPGGVVPPYVVAALNGDVDNHADLRVAHNLRIAAPITTDAKVIPTLVSRFLDTGRRPRRGVPPDGQLVRGFGGDRDGERVRPRHAVPRPARQRPGALHRPGRRLFDRRQRAVRRGRGDERVRASRRRARRRDRGRVGRRRGHARWSAAPRLRRLRPAPDRRRRRHRRGHHPRHQPGRRTALPAEGDLRGAAQLRQDPARQDRRTRRRLRRVGRRGRAADRRSRPASPTDRSRASG